MQDRDTSQRRWTRLGSDRPATILFWYRQRPGEMQSDNFFNSIGSDVITPWEPPSDVTGMISVFLDTQGRLLLFKRIPPERDPLGGRLPSPDWSSLFSAAGLDPSKFTSATPEWSDLLYSDSRAAGTREITTPIQVTERVEAAAYRGKPVYFRVLFPWANPYRDRLHPASAHQKLASIIGIVLFGAVLFGSILIVKRNVKQKRGAEAGSWRLANFLFFVFLALWALQAHHLPSLGEFGTTFPPLASPFLVSTIPRMLSSD